MNVYYQPDAPVPAGTITAALPDLIFKAGFPIMVLTDVRPFRPAAKKKARGT